MTRRKTSSYRVFLTVRADYADTSYWTTDGHHNRTIDLTPRAFDKVMPLVIDYLARTFALIEQAARTEPVEYNVSGIINAYYPDGRQALRHLDVKAASAEDVRNMACAATDKNMKELAAIGGDDDSPRVLPDEPDPPKEGAKSPIVRLFTEGRKGPRQ